MRARTGNPDASPDDVGLLLAYQEGRCVGTLGLVPGRISLGDRVETVDWLSAWYVPPEFRNRMMKRGEHFSDWLVRLHGYIHYHPRLPPGIVNDLFDLPVRVNVHRPVSVRDTDGPEPPQSMTRTTSAKAVARGSNSSKRFGACRNRWFSHSLPGRSKT